MAKRGTPTTETPAGFVGRGEQFVALRLVLASAPIGKKLVLVLDEFQWLCASSPELPLVLQRL